MAQIESRPTYYTELPSKRLHYYLQTAAGAAVSGQIATTNVWIIKNGVGTRTQIVTAGAGRTITEPGSGHYSLTFLASDFDKDGAFTVEIQAGGSAERKVIHMKLDQRGGQRTV